MRVEVRRIKGAFRAVYADANFRLVPLFIRIKHLPVAEVALRRPDEARGWFFTAVAGMPAVFTPARLAPIGADYFVTHVNTPRATSGLFSSPAGWLSLLGSGW